MSEWVTTTLGEIAHWGSGATPKATVADYYGGEIKWATIGDLRDAPIRDTSNHLSEAGSALAGRPVPIGSVLVSMYGTIGRTGMTTAPMYTNQAIAWGKADSTRCLDEFLLLAVQYLSRRLDELGRGATQRNVNRQIVKEQRVALPPLAEQRRIVDAMDAVDAQIQALREECDRCLVAYINASSLLWLDEDGVEPPARPLADVMRLDVERLRLDDAVVYRSAGVLNAGQGLIDKGSFRGDETEYGAMNVLRQGQVVMRKLTAWEGPITVVPAEFDGFIASNEFPTFTLNEYASPDWMRHVCRTTRLWGEMKNRVTGTVQRRKRLNPDQLLAVTLPIPPREIQEQAASALDALDREVVTLREEVARLRSFRSTLLTALLSKEIEIPESYDRLLEPATAGVD